MFGGIQPGRIHETCQGREGMISTSSDVIVSDVIVSYIIIYDLSITVTGNLMLGRLSIMSPTTARAAYILEASLSETC
jgi:hypothetical protein